MFQSSKSVIVASVVSGLVGGFTALTLTGVPGHAQQADQTTFHAVRAQEFQLVDAKGRVRGAMAFSADGQPYLQLRDEQDVSGVWVGVAKETGLAVRDKDGKTRLVLSVDDTGSPSLVVRNREHQTRSFQP
jgi:hypothetical protein